MTDENKNRILYTPTSAPERDYRSEGTFGPEEQNIVVPIEPDKPEQQSDDTPQQIINDLGEISEIIQGLPEELHFLRPSIDRLKERVQVSFPDGKDHVVPKETTPEVGSPQVITPVVTPAPERILKKSILTYIPIADNPNIKQVADDVPNLAPINIRMEIPRTLVQIIQDGYNKDNIRLTQHYIQQLQLVMQKYFQQMIAAMSDCGLENIDHLTRDFDGNYVKIPAGKNLEHLRDYICRSQRQRKQKSNFFKKTHSVDNILIHMRAWHVTAKERERYYTEEYGDSGTYSESHCNALLRESRTMYDEKYDSALYGMYKYLNSAVLLTNDILEATVKEAQAKAHLLNNGVDIFAFDQEEAAANAGGALGNSGQAGDGTGSGFDSISSSTASTGSGSSSSSSVASSTSSSSSSTPSSSTSSISVITTSNILSGDQEANRAILDKVFSSSSGNNNFSFGDLSLDSISQTIGNLGIKINSEKSAESILKESSEAIGNIVSVYNNLQGTINKVGLAVGIVESVFTAENANDPDTINNRRCKEIMKKMQLLSKELETINKRLSSGNPRGEDSKRKNEILAEQQSLSDEYKTILSLYDG